MRNLFLQLLSFSQGEEIGPVGNPSDMEMCMDSCVTVSELILHTEVFAQLEVRVIINSVYQYSALVKEISGITSVYCRKQDLKQRPCSKAG